jgi:hypothetical protein
MPNQLTLSASRDGNTWTQLGVFGNPSANQYVKLNIITDQRFTYFKLTQPSFDAAGGSCGCYHIGFFELYGTVFGQ